MKKLYTLLFALLVAGSAVAQQSITITSSGSLAQVLANISYGPNTNIIIPSNQTVTISSTTSTLDNWNGVLSVRGTLHFNSSSTLNLGQNAQIYNGGAITFPPNHNPNANNIKVSFGNGTGIATSELMAFAGQNGYVLNAGYNSNTPVLPVSLMYFRGKATANSVKLEWATAGEQNNDRFEIEASADGENWSNAGTVNSLNPNSDTRQYYTFEHRASTASYYRLKQVDFTGESSIYTTYVRNGSSVEPVSHIEYRTLDGKLVSGSTPGPKVKVNHYQSGNLSTEVMP